MDAQGAISFIVVNGDFGVATEIYCLCYGRYDPNEILGNPRLPVRPDLAANISECIERNPLLVYKECERKHLQIFSEL